MSKRTRLLELMTAANVGRNDLAREQIRAQRDAGNTAQWIGALSSLVPLAGDLAGKGIDAVEADAMRAAESAVLDGASERGAGMVMTKVGPKGGPEFAESYAESPEKLAQGLVARNAKLAAPVETESGIDNFFANPFGIKGRANEKARLAAAKGLTETVKANRALDAGKAKEKLGFDWEMQKAKTATEAAAAARASDKADKLADRLSREGEGERDRKNALERANIAARGRRSLMGNDRGGRGGKITPEERAAAAAEKARQMEIAKLTSARNSLATQEKNYMTIMENPMGRLDEAGKKGYESKLNDVRKKMERMDSRLETLWSVDIAEEAAPVDAAPQASGEAEPVEEPSRLAKWWDDVMEDDDEGSDAPEKVSLDAAGAGRIYQTLDEEEKEMIDDEVDLLVAKRVPEGDAFLEVMAQFQAGEIEPRGTLSADDLAGASAPLLTVPPKR